MTLKTENFRAWWHIFGFSASLEAKVDKNLATFEDSRTIFHPTKIYRHFSTDIFPHSIFLPDNFPPDKFPPGGTFFYQDISLPGHFSTRIFLKMMYHNIKPILMPAGAAHLP